MKRIEVPIEIGSQWSVTFDRPQTLAGIELPDDANYTLLSDVVLRVEIGGEQILVVPLSFLQMWRLAKPVEIPPRTPLQIAVRTYGPQIPGEYVHVVVLLGDPTAVQPSSR